MKHLISSVIAVLFQWKNFPSKSRAWSWIAQESCTKILRFKYASHVLVENHGAQQQWYHKPVDVNEMLSNLWVTICETTDIYEFSVAMLKDFGIWTMWQKHCFWASWSLIIWNANPGWKSLLIWLKTLEEGRDVMNTFWLIQVYSIHKMLYTTG